MIKQEREKILSSHHIDVFTPETIAGLGYDSHLQDAMFLLRQGIWELRDMNGMQSVRDWQPEYDVIVEDSATNITLWKHIEEGNRQQHDDRKPFLLIDWNTRDGIVGVVEGREYHYRGTGERAIFINLVVVRNCASNDDDEYSYRGKRLVGGRLYKKVEELARNNTVTLLIAGVNCENKGSVRFHEKNGFVNEQYSEELAISGPDFAYRTENGAYVPPYREVDDGSSFERVIEFYTKRLR